MRIGAQHVVQVTISWAQLLDVQLPERGGPPAPLFFSALYETFELARQSPERRLGSRTESGQSSTVPLPTEVVIKSTQEATRRNPHRQGETAGRASPSHAGHPPVLLDGQRFTLVC